MKDKLLRFGTVLTLVSSMAASAIEKAPLATAQFYGATVSFSAKTNASNTTLNISGPGGFQARKFSMVNSRMGCTTMKSPLVSAKKYW